MKNRNKTELEDLKRALFYMSALIAALVLYAWLHAAPVRAATMVPTAHRHCVCKEFGPRGGCRRWTCRRQYERAR